MTAALALAPAPFDALPRTPASDVKKLGWRGVMQTVGREGTVLVTNHDRPEAVILSTAEYQRLLQAAARAQAAQGDALAALRRRFDAFLLRLPLLGRLLRDVHAARMARTLATMSDSGLPLIEGLAITARTVGNSVLREATESMVEVIREGERLTRIDLDHLECTVATVEAVILERDGGFGSSRDLAVDGCDFLHVHDLSE